MDIIFVAESNLIEYFKIMLTPKLQFQKLNVSIIEASKTNEPENYLPSNKSLFNIYILDNFITQHYLSKSKDYDEFISILTSFLEPLIPIVKTILESVDKSIFSLFSTSYITNDCTFEYIFDFGADNNGDFINAFEQALKSIEMYTDKNHNHHKSTIMRAFSQLDKKNFEYVNETWLVIDAAAKQADHINIQYRKNKDNRIKKPHILLNESNIFQKVVFDQNWVLTFDGLETMMIKPNDVSIYSSITEKTLLKAREFYSAIIFPRFKQYQGTFPHVKLQGEYYDYFELIIQAIIFSHTSIEAFVNIFVPEVFEYKNGEGKPVAKTKYEIERNFSLENKLVKVLQHYLETPNPKEQIWWDQFLKLKDIRDEIIHTKQVKSEDRYSKFLSKEIFDTITVYREILNFYGYYIEKNRPNLINDFPYNFGHDNISPGFMSDKNYRNARKILDNPNFKVESKKK